MIKVDGLEPSTEFKILSPAAHILFHSGIESRMEGIKVFGIQMLLHNSQSFAKNVDKKEPSVYEDSFLYCIMVRNYPVSSTDY